MADVFISYARPDRARIEALASALEAVGFSVWWDRSIAGGVEFSKEIERELAVTKAVLVAWSAAGNESHWVRDEASTARDANKLIPITLDGKKPPMGFRQFNALDFQVRMRLFARTHSASSLIPSINKSMLMVNRATMF